IDSHRPLAVWSAKFVERVQVGIVVLEERASVKRIRAALGHYFYLRSGVAAVFRGVTARQNLNLSDRLLIRSNYRGSTPRLTVNADPIDLKVIKRYALSVGRDGHLILGLED